jgi:MFS transporter, DHA1 family, solute carrier family 18 (vesicular acetylcholine transporter), member 3
MSSLVVAVASVATLLDGMLHTIIVPMIPQLLEDEIKDSNTSAVGFDAGEISFIDVSTAPYESPGNVTGNEYESAGVMPIYGSPQLTHNAGILVASKPLTQLLTDLIIGSFLDRVMYESSLFTGLTVLFLSCLIFAFGSSYELLVMARCVQGVGSAMTHSSAYALLSIRFTDVAERTKVLGIVGTSTMLGYLIAPPLGGFLHQFAGKTVAFLTLASAALIDGLLLLLVVWKPWLQQTIWAKEFLQDGIENEKSADIKRGVPLYRLLLDPYVIVCLFTVVVGNINLSFLEPTIALWMTSFLDVDEWEIGVAWLPTLVSYAFGLFITTLLTRKFPQKRWLIIIAGMLVESISCLLIPLASDYVFVVITLMTICFGISLVNTTILPIITFIGDVRHGSSYGSLFALKDICYLIGFAAGPIIAYWIYASFSFLTLMIVASLLSALFVPVLLSLRSLNQYERLND